MKVVLANGCFDLLHYGHILHLQEAAKLGYLVVALTEDAHVNKMPGMPIWPWAERAEMLRELRCVREVIASKDGVQAIYQVRPDIFVKGIDYVSGLSERVKKACSEVGAEIVFTSTPKYSTSDLIKRIKEEVV